MVPERRSRHSPGALAPDSRRAAALQPAATTGVVDENAAHRFRRRREEVPAAVPELDLGRVYKAEIRLMDQRRRLEGLPRLFMGELRDGQLAQLVVNEWQELLGSMRIALFDPRQNARHVGHD